MKLLKILVFFIGLALAVALPCSTFAATFNIADGDVPGLIDAIEVAISNGEEDIILLAEKGTYTLSPNADFRIPSGGKGPGPSGLVITSAITIKGNGSLIERDANLFTAPDRCSGLTKFRIIHVYGGGTLTLEDVTIQNGCAFTGVYNSGRGGGILNNGITILTRSTVCDNASDDSSGGGICNAGSGGLTLTDSTVCRNTVANGGGGGIYNTGSGGLTLTDSTVSDNTASGEGGGILNSDTATLTNCTISNSSAGVDGGISNSGTATLTNCTISNNYGEDGSGGIWNGGTATMTGCTISNNTADWRAGGIVNGGTATLTNCTISNNDGDGSQGGGIWNSGILGIKNSIVANNTLGGDCFGGITSLDYNLDSDGTCNLTQPNDLPNTDPLLGGFIDDGFSGEGHFPLLEGSPAIDSGNDDECPPTDQLGNLRVDGDDDGFIVCDIGAIEFQIEDAPDGGAGGGGK